MNSSLNRKISIASLLRFSLPTIISMVFMGFYTTVDGIFVSRLVGTDALSAVNIVWPMITAALAVGTMLGSGGSAIVARNWAPASPEEARQNFSLILLTALAASLLLVILGFLTLNPFIRFLGADDLLFPYCLDYAVPSLYLFPFAILSMVFQVFFIAAGKAPLGLFISILGGLCNIVLDYVFIALLGWGIAGAAIATGAGYSLTAIVGIFYFWLNRRGSLYLVRPRWDFRVIIKSCTNGSSEMVTNLSMGVTTLMLNRVLMRLSGPDGVASITIILYVYSLLSSAYIGYSMGIAPIISYNYGRQDTARLKKIFRISILCIACFSVFTLLLSLLSASGLVSIFSPKGSSVYGMAVQGFRLFSVCFLFIGFNGFGSAMFTALSDGRVSAILSFLRTLLFAIAAIAIFPAIWGINGVWLAIPAAELLGFAVTVYYWIKMRTVYHYI